MLGGKTGKVGWDDIVSVLECQAKELEMIVKAIGK